MHGKIISEPICKSKQLFRCLDKGKPVLWDIKYLNKYHSSIFAGFNLKKNTIESVLYYKNKSYGSGLSLGPEHIGFRIEKK
jgi:hypothetical protein